MTAVVFVFVFVHAAKFLTFREKTDCGFLTDGSEGEYLKQENAKIYVSTIS